MATATASQPTAAQAAKTRNRRGLSSLTKKYLMALSGLVLVGFVLGHMAGNLQYFGAPDMINAYAYKLKTLPYGLLWVVRAGLLAAAVVHVWMAISLTLENRRARPESYQENDYVQASYSARTMRWSGFILLAFIVFHLFHYTVRVVPGMEYEQQLDKVELHQDGKPVMKGGEPLEVFNVHKMMYLGFSNPLVSGFYFLAVGLLCAHLTHGVSSMFQSLGLRNETWRRRLDAFALAYGWVVFLGFASVPVAVLFFDVGGSYYA
ncbi:MAG: succinate dehydrogenase cytochrome b subunit [Opitutales bacterium]